METVRRLEQLRTVQRVLDEAFRIPGTRVRFGWDAVAGLVPGVGDLISGLFGLTILYHAHRMRVPGIVLTRMVINLGVDLVLGLVPVIGDLADVFWKANTRNLAALERHVAQERPPTSSDWWFVCGVAALLAVMAALPLAAVLVAGRLVGVW